MKNSVKCKICCKDDEFIKSDTYEECIHYAFYNKNRKKYSHQRRLTKATLDTYKNKLLQFENEFKDCINFDEIYEFFKKHRVPGIGDLTIYDVALRVSQNYGIYPDYVYLHAGTKVGALNAGLIKKHSRKDKLTLDEITEKLKWLKGVKPYLIEDFLCIYKNCINEENFKKYIKRCHKQ